MGHLIDRGPADEVLGVVSIMWLGSFTCTGNSSSCWRHWTTWTLRRTWCRSIGNQQWCADVLAWRFTRPWPRVWLAKQHYSISRDTDIYTKTPKMVMTWKHISMAIQTRMIRIRQKTSGGEPGVAIIWTHWMISARSTWTPCSRSQERSWTGGTWRSSETRWIVQLNSDLWTIIDAVRKFTPWRRQHTTPCGMRLLIGRWRSRWGCK